MGGVRPLPPQGELHRPRQGGVWNASDRRGTPPGNTHPALPRMFPRMFRLHTAYPTDIPEEEYKVHTKPRMRRRHNPTAIPEEEYKVHAKPRMRRRRNPTDIPEEEYKVHAKPRMCRRRNPTDIPEEEYKVHAKPRMRRRRKTTSGARTPPPQTRRRKSFPSNSTVQYNFLVISSRRHSTANEAEACFGERVTCGVRLLLNEEGSFFQNSTRSHLWFRM